MVRIFTPIASLRLIMCDSRGIQQLPDFGGLCDLAAEDSRLNVMLLVTIFTRVFINGSVVLTHSHSELP